MNSSTKNEQFVKPKLLHNPFLENLNSVRPPLFSPQGMQLPRQLQPPPMYGPRGATLPPKFLNPSKKAIEKSREPDKNFWCQTCDMEFNSFIHFQKHNKQHKSCGIDNCSFIGTEYAVSQHVLNQHSTGIYDTIKNLNTPEDIAKWREERKKKYPTVRNVELRQKAQDERKKRGEKLRKPNNRFANKHDQRELRKRERNSSNSMFNKRNYKDREIFKRPNPAVNAKTIVLKSERKTITDTKTDELFDSTSYIENYKNLPNFKGTSSVYSPEKKTEPESHPLLSMLGMYGSSEEELSSDNDDDNQLLSTNETDKDSSIVYPQHDISIIQSFAVQSENCKLSSDSEPEEFAIERHIKEELVDKVNEPLIVEIEPKVSESSNVEHQSTANLSKRNRNSRQRQNPIKSRRTILNYKKLHNFKQNTMLAKLLETDIRHERNLLLQCVRYVVDNNFFSK